LEIIYKSNQSQVKAWDSLYRESNEEKRKHFNLERRDWEPN